MAINTICAWCGKDLGQIGSESDTGTSHGVCDECVAKLVQTKFVKESAQVVIGEEKERRANERLASENEGQS